MSRANLFLWVIVPYMSIAVFLGGHVWRYRRDQFGWTSRSSQLLESRLLRVGNPLFHYGALAAIAGHVLGILIPNRVTEFFGVSEDTYHRISVGAGTVAWVAVIIGVAILAYRRLVVPQVRVTTTRMDWLMMLLLLVVILLGVWETAGTNLLLGGYDYRETVSVWFRGILIGDPHPELMTSAPLVYQLHAIAAWGLFAIWPFTRLVHAWSIPFAYIGRPQILYRRAAPAREPERAR